MNEQDDGQRLRAAVVKTIVDHVNSVGKKNTVKVLLSINNETGEDIFKYNQLLDYIAKDDENETHCVT
jgi:hypothetical protein